MKICHIATGFPLSYKGGVTNYVRTLAQEQFNNGNEVWVIADKDNQEFDYNYYAYSGKLPAFSFADLEDAEGLKKLDFFFKKHQFDIIHIHMVLGLDWNLGSILKKYKYIISLHDYNLICPWIYMNHNSKGICVKYDEEKCKKCISYLDKYSIYKKCVNYINRKINTNFRVPYIPQKITSIRYEKYKMLAENACMLLPVSTRVEEIFRMSGIKNNYKVMHIGNKTADSYRESYTINMEPHIIKLVFIGRLCPEKGVVDLIKISKNLDKDKFEIHFWGASNQYKLLLEENSIIDHGTYNPSDLGDLLQNYDMGLCLSTWEDNGPQVVMELLNNRIPVIGTHMGGIPDFVVDGLNGFLYNPYSEDEFIKVLNRIRTLTPEIINDMKKNCIRTTTSMEHYLDVMRVYEKILEIE